MPFTNYIGSSSITQPGVCTSATRPATPYRGQVIYETDTDILAIWNGSAWRYIAATTPTSGSILQVQSATKTDTFTFSASSTWTDITGLSVLITPKSTTSKVLIQAMLTGVFYRPTQNAVYTRIMRDSTAIGIGDAASNRPRATASQTTPTSIASDPPSSLFISYLDSPASTSAITYKIQMWQDTPANPPYINRTVADNDAGSGGRTISTITVMEIAG